VHQGTDSYPSVLLYDHVGNADDHCGLMRVHTKNQECYHEVSMLESGILASMVFTLVYKASVGVERSIAQPPDEKLVQEIADIMRCVAVNVLRL